MDMFHKFSREISWETNWNISRFYFFFILMYLSLDFWRLTPSIQKNFFFFFWHFDCFHFSRGNIDFNKKKKCEKKIRPSGKKKSTTFCLCHTLCQHSVSTSTKKKKNSLTGHLHSLHSLHQRKMLFCMTLKRIFTCVAPIRKTESCRSWMMTGRGGFGDKSDRLYHFFFNLFFIFLFLCRLWNTSKDYES